MRVPMIFTNPVFINPTGKPQQTKQLGSLVDIMPTVAGILGMPHPEGARGVNLGPAIRHPRQDDSVQDAILFTYDDVRAGNPDKSESVSAANRIRCIRTEKWKFARYFHQDGSYLQEYELYYLVGKGYGQNPTPAEISALPPAEQELVRLLLEYPLEYVNLAYDKNPLMEGWPPEVMALIVEAREELELRLAQEEVKKLTFNSLELRKKLAGLAANVPTTTN